IWTYHAQTLGWGDIGYNFLVDAAGNIYEGRFGGDNVIAGHAYCFNSGSSGIALLGDFRTDPVPQMMRDGLVGLLAWLCFAAGLTPRKSGFMVDRILANICGPRDGNGACNISTTCPGASLYTLLPPLRDATWAALPDYGEAFTAHTTPAAMVSGGA